MSRDIVNWKRKKLNRQRSFGFKKLMNFDPLKKVTVAYVDPLEVDNVRSAALPMLMGWGSGHVNLLRGEGISTP